MGFDAYEKKDFDFVPVGRKVNMSSVRTADGKPLYPGMLVYGYQNREFEIKGFSTDMKYCIYKDGYGELVGFPVTECWRQIKSTSWGVAEGVVLDWFRAGIFAVNLVACLGCAGVLGLIGYHICLFML